MEPILLVMVEQKSLLTAEQTTRLRLYDLSTTPQLLLYTP